MAPVTSQAALEAPKASYWQSTAERTSPVAPQLPHDCDVVIVGAGLAGLSAAISIMELAPFTRVTVLESAYAGYGASGRAGGLLSPLAAPVWLATAQHDASHAWALAYLRTLVGGTAAWIKSAIPESEIKTETLTLEATGPLTGIGLSVLSGILESGRIPHRLAPERSGQPGLSLACHTVNPFGLVQGLARHARALGVAIHEGTPVARIEDTDRGAYLTLSGGQTLLAGTAIVCTNAYSDGVKMARPAKAKVVSNYMVATKPLSPHALATIGKAGRFTVELNGAYVFYRLHEGRLLFGGIEKLGRPGGGGYHVPAAVEEKLNSLIQRSFPGMESFEIDHAWGGQFHMTATDLPEIRRLPKPGSEDAGAIVMNTGYGGTGIALTLAMSSHVAALALRRPAVEPDDDRLAAIMAQTRIPVASLTRYAARIGWTYLRGLAVSPRLRRSANANPAALA